MEELLKWLEIINVEPEGKLEGRSGRLSPRPHYSSLVIEEDLTN